MDRFLPDLTDTLEWNLVARNSYTATSNGDGTIRPIPPLNFLIENSHVCMVGVKSPTALSRWYTGGWVAQRLLFSPSSLSEFVANVQTTNQKIKLGTLNLIEFPKLVPVWMLYLKIPKWINSATVEIWKYDGRDYDAINNGAIQSTAKNVAQTTATVTILEASQTRRGAIVLNNSSANLALDFDLAPTFDAPTILAPGGYFELPYSYKGNLFGKWDVAGSGNAIIREFD